MNKIVKTTLIVISCLLLLSVVTGSYIILNKHNIYNGVKIKGLDVGSRSGMAAEIYLKSKLDQDVSDKEFLFLYSKYSKALKYKDLGIEYDYAKAVREAHEVGRKGNIFTRLIDIAKVSFEDRNIELEFKKNDEKLNVVLEQINKENFVEKKDATIRYSNGKFVFTDEIIGISIDLEALKKDVETSIGQFDVIEMPIKRDLPRATRKELEKVKEEVGTYSTSFRGSDSGRVHNVKRASNSIDGRILLPGETFSFNETVGQTSLKTGYRMATIIMNGAFVPGVGGGICQVSSTLYNALPPSSISIVERHRHSLPINYVPPGKDATVAYDILDFKFQNDYSAPVYIKSHVQGTMLTVKIYGNKDFKI